MSRTATHRSDEGVTLIELLVTMFILSIVSLMLFTFMTGVTNVTARTDRHVQAEQEAQLALRRMTQEIRAANPLLGAAGCAAGLGDCLSLDVPHTTDFTRECIRQTVSYKLDRTARQITRETTDWVWNSATSTCIQTNVGASRVLISSVSFPAATPLFVYTNESGDVLSPSDPDILLPPNQNGTAAVRVNLVLRYQERGAPDLTLNSNAVLRNNR